MGTNAKKQAKSDRAARKARLKSTRFVCVPGADGLRDEVVLPSGQVRVFADLVREAAALVRKGSGA